MKFPDEVNRLPAGAYFWTIRDDREWWCFRYTATIYQIHRLLGPSFRKNQVFFTMWGAKRWLRKQCRWRDPQIREEILVAWSEWSC